MIFISIKLIIYIFVLTFFSWQFSRTILKQNKLYTIIPLLIIIGASVYTFLLNVLSYLIHIRYSAWLILVLLFLTSIILIKLKRHPLEIGLNKKILLTLIFFTIFIGYFFGIILLTTFPYDLHGHRPLISTIANGNFPPKWPYSPEYYAQYHYGIDLFAASIEIISGVPTWLASDIAMILLVLFTFWLCFLIIYKFTKNYLTSLLAAWLFFFGSGYTYIKFLTSVAWPNYFSSLCDKFLSIPAFASGYFHGNTVDAFGVILFHRPSSFAMPLVFLIIYLIYLENKQPKQLKYKIILGIFFGFLALVSEVRFVLLIAAWLIWKIFIFISKNQFTKSKLKYFIKNTSIVFLIACCLAIFQGGMITDLLLHSSIETNLKTAENINKFNIRSVPGVVSFAGYYPFTNSYSWIILITEWGLQFLLLPFIIFLIIKKNNKYLNFILIIILFCLLSYFFIDYTSSPPEMVRVAGFAYYFINILFAIFLIDWIKNKKHKKGIIAIVVILLSISPLLFNIKSLSSNNKIAGPDYDKNEFIVAKKINNIIPNEAIILTASPIMLTDLWGNLVYFSPSRGHSYEESIKMFNEYINNLTIEKILAKGIDYLYINPDFNNVLDQFIINNKNNLEEIYNLNNQYIVYKIK